MVINKIDIQWIGLRRNSKKGIIWGWFVMPGNSLSISSNYQKPNRCFVFRGKIGEKLFIEKRNIDTELFAELKQKRNNFKQQDPTDIGNRWGKIIEEEFNMFLLYRKLNEGN